MYKIFFNNNCIKLPVVARTGECNYRVQLSEFKDSYTVFLDKVRKDSANVCIECKDEETVCFDEFKANFKVIKAAGGIVVNRENKILLIKRNGVWDLPKGKNEPGENLDETALREVKEECGIDDLSIESFFDTTYHIYDTYGFWAFKETYWYVMKSDEKHFTPQIEEGIEKIILANKEDIKNLTPVYPLISQLIKKFYRL